tara:strand:+ start:1329 stop:1856 length:528 start_codon:yes stop_codon:yes gene_type:complete
MESSIAMEDTHNEISYHKLHSQWTLWAHLPHDTDWTLKSYKNIMTFSTIEDMHSLINYIPEKMIKNCMLFIMRYNVKPTWEDPINRNGGCFSYKIFNKNVAEIWKLLCYAVTGESISNNQSFINSVVGITISPKKNFCIIKLWMSNCNNQDSSKIINLDCLNSYNCIFKKHTPEY